VDRLGGLLVDLVLHAEALAFDDSGVTSGHLIDRAGPGVGGRFTPPVLRQIQPAADSSKLINDARCFSQGAGRLLHRFKLSGTRKDLDEAVLLLRVGENLLAPDDASRGPSVGQSRLRPSEMLRNTTTTTQRSTRLLRFTAKQGCWAPMRLHS
jgi:hypothetical protein